MTIEKEFIRCQNTIKQKAFFYAKTYFIEYEEMEAQANLIFCETYQKYNKNRNVLFNTFLNHTLSFGLYNFCKKMNKQKLYCVETEILESIYFIEKKYKIIDDFSTLTNDAKKLINWIFTPIGKKDKMTKQKIKKWLRKQNYSVRQTGKILLEIENFISKCTI